MGPLICMILLTSSCRKTQCIAVKESCYVYIAVSLKNNAIASNSTRKCAFRGGMPLFLQYTFQLLAVNLTYCTFKSWKTLKKVLEKYLNL